MAGEAECPGGDDAAQVGRDGSPLHPAGDHLQDVAARAML
jgi:hypothetical protein